MLCIIAEDDNCKGDLFQYFYLLRNTNKTTVWTQNLCPTIFSTENLFNLNILYKGRWWSYVNIYTESGFDLFYG
jgi:hypothetical protein